MKRLWMAVIACGLAWLLTGCSAFVDQDQASANAGSDVELQAGHTVGQTFVARHGGLQGLEVWLDPETGVAGDLVLHLRTDPTAAADLAEATLPLSQVTNTGFYRFLFPPLHETTGGYYYAFLELNGEGELDVGTGAGDAYLDGALYVDHEPRDAQMAFRLVYDPLWVAVDLGKAAVSGVGLLGVAILLYCVPGWALLAWLWPAAKLSWAERAGIAVGLSLALYPLLVLWTDLVGIHLGALYAWGPVVGGLAALAWRHRQWRPADGWKALQAWLRSPSVFPDVTLIFVLVLVFGVRLITVRTLDAPMWGDSYQHTMITQLLLDNGGLFTSWQPYAELKTFTYHFGFHTLVAAFCWLTGMGAVQAIIWVGQLLNGLGVFVLFALAKRVGGNHWAGVIAVLVAGLLSPMPMYYVNWGRYTQLAGQVILPAAIVVSWTAFEAPRIDKRLFALAWIMVAGLALTHYRVLIFYILFVVAWLLISLKQHGWKTALARVTWIGVGGAVLFLPWFIQGFSGKILANFGRQLTTLPMQVSSYEQQYNSSIGELTIYLSPLGWILLIFSMAVGFWRQQKGVLLVSLWWFLLVLATNPAWLYLPGSGAISNFAVFIAVYILAGVLVGSLAGYLFLHVNIRLWPILVFAAVAALGLWGARSRLSDVHISPYTLVTRPDARAALWMRENTPENARFLINSFPAYGDYAAVVGSDGGWWLPLLAQRANTVPPLTYIAEQTSQSDYSKQVLSLTEQLEESDVDAVEVLAMLDERGVTHVYIGQQHGRVNYGGPYVLDPEALLTSDHYHPIYQQDRVWIFERVR